MVNEVKDFVEACSRWKRLIMVNSMQANEAPQERMSAAWRLHKRGYEPRRGSVMVKTIDTTTTHRLRCSPLYSDLSPSCARKRACMELTTICRFQRLWNPSFQLFQCFRLRHVSKSLTHCWLAIKTNQRIHRKCFKESFFAVGEGPLQREISHAGKFIPFC